MMLIEVISNNISFLVFFMFGKIVGKITNIKFTTSDF